MKLRLTWILSLGLLALLGCGPSGPELAPVSGKVTVDGKPVQEGTVMFTPENGPTATAMIAKDGTYTLSTLKPGDGAMVGKHKVTVTAVNVGPGSLIDAPKSLEEEVEASRKPNSKILVAGKVTYVVPERYSQPETSDLVREVNRGPNVIDLEFPKP